MVSYISWYKHLDNGEHTLIRYNKYSHNFTGSLEIVKTGVNKGNPYNLVIEVSTGCLKLYELYLMQNAVPEDGGRYSCVAGNVLGETMASAFLQVSHSQSSHSCLAVIISSLLLSSYLDSLLNYFET